MRKIVVTFLVYALLFLSIAAVLIAIGRAETTHNRPNTLGVSETYTNENTYLLGLPIEGTDIEGGMSIRFWPFATPSLYDETVYFCKVDDQFDGKKGVLVVTYKTRAHHMHQGIACHDLVSVFEVAK